MSYIQSDSTVFIFFNDTRGRIWVAGTEVRRDKLGNLVLVPVLDDEARNAKPWRYDMALVAARRFNTEGYLNPAIYQAKFALQASNSAQEISSEVAPVTKDDRRVPMHYKGLLAVPGRHMTEGECWYVRFPGTTIESIRGSSVEEVVDKTIERCLQDQAEKYYPPVEEPVQGPPQPKKKKYSGAKVRPGSIQ